MRLAVNGGFFWQPDNEEEPDFLGEDTSTANMAVSDKPISDTLLTRKNNNRNIMKYDPYKGAQNIAKGSKTLIGSDDNFLKEYMSRRKTANILDSLFEEAVKYPLGKEYNAKDNIEHDIVDPYEGNIFDDEEAKDSDKTKMGCSCEYKDNEEVSNILESIYESAKFDTAERRKLSKKGEAEKDGSFPIRNKKDLKNAIHDWGRGGSKKSDKQWIIKRAKALGAYDTIPDKWKNEAITRDNLNSLIENIIHSSKKRAFSSDTKLNLHKLLEAVSQDNVQLLLDKLAEVDNANYKKKDKQKIKAYIEDELKDMGYMSADGSFDDNLITIDKDGKYRLKTPEERTKSIDKIIHSKNDNNDDNYSDLQESIDDNDSNSNIIGKRVELINMKDDYTDLKQGDKGTIRGKDALGDLLVDWDNGSGLKLIPNVDEYKIIDDENELSESKKSKKKKKFDKVMGEFKKGKLHSGNKHGKKVINPKQAVAIAYSESDENKKNESINAKIKLPFLSNGKLKTLMVNKESFSKFVKNNCETDNYVNENKEFDVIKYIESRPINFKQTLIESYIKANKK